MRKYSKFTIDSAVKRWENLSAESIEYLEQLALEKNILVIQSHKPSQFDLVTAIIFEEYGHDIVMHKRFDPQRYPKFK